MLLLLLVLLVVGFALAVALWLGAVWLQGYIYNEPSLGLEWRAPAAGAALMVFLALWCLVNYRWGNPATGDVPFSAWWDFTAADYWPPKGFPQFISIKNGQETVYVARHKVGGGTVEYRDQATQRPWTRESGGVVEAVVIEENGQKVKFLADLTPDHKFRTEPARYLEEGGSRVLTEEDVKAGQIRRFYGGRLAVYFIFNLLHLAVWFACLWLLLRFQWSHALGLAVVLWLVMMLAVWPLLVTRTSVAVRQKPVPSPVALRSDSDGRQRIGAMALP
jgi:hypothetical protein